MKRSLENDGNGVARLPKRIKLVCPEGAIPQTEPQIYQGMFYCERDIHNCSFVTRKIEKIKEHHALHEAPLAITCAKCDFLAKNKQSLSNHALKWHATNDSGIKPVIAKSTINKCRYCGIQGGDLARHYEIYHKKSVFRKNHTYRLVLQPRSPKLLSISTSSDSSVEIE
jgi:hypothetical protein